MLVAQQTPQQRHKVPIIDCIDKMIVCPDCGKPARIGHAIGSKRSGVTISAQWWVMMRCTGHCGAKLMKRDMMVELQPDPEPVLTQMALSAAVGRWVLCPKKDCQLVSRALFNSDPDDSGSHHMIDCLVHPGVTYDPSMMVDLAPGATNDV